MSVELSPLDQVIIDQKQAKKLKQTLKIGT